MTEPAPTDAQPPSDSQPPILAESVPEPGPVRTPALPTASDPMLAQMVELSETAALAHAASNENPQPAPPPRDPPPPDPPPALPTEPDPGLVNIEERGDPSPSEHKRGQ